MRQYLLSLAAAAVFAPLLPAAASAQGNCAGQINRDQFDFWVGDWNLYDGGGAFLGRHSVEESEAGCLIEASWTGSDGRTNISMNVYDPFLNSWRHIFVSPEEIADLRGSFGGSTMVLEGNLFTHETQTQSLRRFQVTNNGNGTLGYLIEERANAGAAWSAVWTATAQPAASDPNSPAVPTPTPYPASGPNCWGQANRRDFDFWAGYWNVGASRNRITKMQGGCLLQEDWSGAGGGTGRSYNYYDPFVSQWRQVWISPGVFIDYTGGLNGANAMVLVGNIAYHNGARRPFRGTWTPNSATVMNQFLEEQVSGVWNSWFNSNYFRSNLLNETLTVTRSGLGTGTVTSAPGGIDCGSDCSESYAVDSRLIQSGNGAAGSSFAGWSDGPCHGQAGNCDWLIGDETTAEARFTLDNVPEGRIVAAMLPGARSGYVGGPGITIFASVVSRQSTPAQSCTIQAPANAPASLSYRRVNASNVAEGPPNPVFDLANGGTQSFVLGLTPEQATAAAGYTFFPVIACQNATLSPIEGVNSFTLSIGSNPVPDILSISATPSSDGVIRIAESGGISFMTAAALNIGAGDGSAGAGETTVTVFADDGGANLPLTLEVCETGPMGGCLAPRSSEVTTVFGTDPKYFAVFVRDTGTGVTLSPGTARVFMRFRDSGGVIRSVTSAAVTAPAPG